MRAQTFGLILFNIFKQILIHGFFKCQQQETAGERVSERERDVGL